jgi:hypothetical protein
MKKSRLESRNRGNLDFHEKSHGLNLETGEISIFIKKSLNLETGEISIFMKKSKLESRNLENPILFMKVEILDRETGKS